MRIAQSLRVSLIVSGLLAISLLPASSAELRPVPVHKPGVAAVHKTAVAVVHPQKPVRHRLIRVANGPSLPRSGCALACRFPLVLGVAY